jgi:hypothetical protein
MEIFINFRGKKEAKLQNLVNPQTLQTALVTCSSTSCSPPSATDKLERDIKKKIFLMNSHAYVLKRTSSIKLHTSSRLPPLKEELNSLLLPPPL